MRPPHWHRNRASARKPPSPYPSLSAEDLNILNLVKHKWKEPRAKTVQTRPNVRSVFGAPGEPGLGSLDRIPDPALRLASFRFSDSTSALSDLTRGFEFRAGKKTAQAKAQAEVRGEPDEFGLGGQLSGRLRASAAPRRRSRPRTGCRSPWRRPRGSQCHEACRRRRSPGTTRPCSDP
jgi:hypothetical protein